MRQLKLTGSARRDFSDAFAWYERERAGAPAIDDRLRRFVLRRFPYVLIFEATETQIIVHALFHTSRDPAKLRRRAGRP